MRALSVTGFELKGTVKSEEDHGYTVNVGVAGVSAFLPNKFVKVTNDNLVVGSDLDLKVHR